jgi:ABC-type lipoprotein export system ATPase subunit
MDIDSTQLFKHPFRCSIVGSSGSGKSYMLSDMIMNKKYGFLDKFEANKIFILSPTAEVDSSQ